MTKTAAIIPPEALAQHLAILGKTGSGKTYTAKTLVEGLLEAMCRVCIIDPTGVWWGLRSSADGTAPGFPVVILGGSHADATLPPLSGAACAELVAKSRVQVVFDTSLMSVGERTRWFTDFANALFRLNTEPLHVVIDEAHMFAPQGGGGRLDPEAGKMLHAANTLASGGRSRGVRLMLITQRPAKLHKDSLTCCDTLIAMRVIAPQDRQAVRDWVDGCGDQAKGKHILETLAGLKRGEGWVWYPEGNFLERMRFPTIRTFDSSRTPEDGAGALAPATLADIDLSAITKAMGDAVEKAKANDPAHLRERIRELEAKLRDATTGDQTPPDPRMIEIAVAKARREAASAFAPFVKQIGDSIEHIHSELESHAHALESMHTLMTAQPEAPAPRMFFLNEQHTTIVPKRHHASGSDVRAHVHGSNGTTTAAALVVERPHADSSLPRMHRAFLTVLGQRGAMKKNRLLLFSGYASSGDTSLCFADLARRGLIESVGGEVSITKAGAEALGPVESLPKGKALRDQTVAKLSKCEGACLAAWFDAYPDSLSKTEVLKRAGYKSSGDTSLAFAALTRRGFIVKHDRDYRAAPEFFA